MVKWVRPFCLLSPEIIEYSQQVFLYLFPEKHRGPSHVFTVSTLREPLIAPLRETMR